MRGLTSGAHKEASSAQFESYAKALRSSLAGRDIDLSRSDWLEIMSHGLAVSVVGSNPRRKVEPWRGGLSFRKRQN